MCLCALQSFCAVWAKCGAVCPKGTLATSSLCLAQALVNSFKSWRTLLGDSPGWTLCLGGDLATEVRAENGLDTPSVG